MADVKVKLWKRSVSIDELFMQLQKSHLHYPLQSALFQAVLIQRAMEEHKIPTYCTAEREEQLLQRFCQQQNISDLNALGRFLEQTGQKRQELIQRLFYTHRMELLKMQVVTKKQLTERFTQRRPYYDQVLFQLLRFETLQAAESVYQALTQNKGDFTTLVHSHSTSKSATNSGVIGPVSPTTLNPILFEQLKNLPAGYFTKPFQLDESSVVIARMLRFAPAELTPQLERQLREELFQQWLAVQEKSAEASMKVW